VLVEGISKVKEKNPEAETSALEKEIDRIVYELYELTQEEIRFFQKGTVK